MSKHLTLNFYTASYENENRHPLDIMKSLGITYQHKTPQSMGDCWWFWNCKNIPEVLPSYIKELKSFKLIYNGDIIYNSSLSKNNSNLIFESDYFTLFGKKYSYNGLRIQKI